MRTVWKYTVTVPGGVYNVPWHPGVSRVLRAEIRPDSREMVVDFWVVTPQTDDLAPAFAEFQVFGTGLPITDDDVEIVATAPGPVFVWHLGMHLEHRP